MITVLLVNVGCRPEIVEIEDSLQGIYAAVGCDCVQAVPIGGGYSAWMDDNGLANGKTPNGCGFLGNYFFSKNNDWGDLVSLDEKDIERLMRYWKANKDVQHSMQSNWNVQSFNSIDDAFGILRRNAEEREKYFRDTQGD